MSEMSEMSEMLDEPTKYAIIDTWLVEDVGSCNCGAAGNLYPHEQYCGYEPIMDLSTLEGFKKLREAHE